MEAKRDPILTAVEGMCGELADHLDADRFWIEARQLLAMLEQLGFAGAELHGQLAQVAKLVGCRVEDGVRKLLISMVEEE